MGMARELDLDLVEVAPLTQPPVCRIMDYGKYKYERDVRQKEARKKQSRVEVKEIKMRPKIDRHDYGTKKGHVERFLKAGARVKVTIMFRGREMAHTELGRKLLDRLTEDLTELATVETYPKLDGRNMVMVLAPVKRPTVRPEAEGHEEREEREAVGQEEREAVGQEEREAVGQEEREAVGQESFEQPPAPEPAPVGDTERRV